MIQKVKHITVALLGFGFKLEKKNTFYVQESEGMQSTAVCKTFLLETFVKTGRNQVI